LFGRDAPTPKLRNKAHQAGICRDLQLLKKYANRLNGDRHQGRNAGKMRKAVPKKALTPQNCTSISGMDAVLSHQIQHIRSFHAIF